MSTALQTNLDRLRVLVARARQRIGWAGLVGTGLIVGAIALLGVGWSAQQEFRASASARKAMLDQEAVATVVRPPAPSSDQTLQAPALPGRSDVPLLLTQMEQAALGNGLSWPGADYRIVAATASQPASLEVRCTLKGTYPKLRAMLVQLMSSVPAFSLRQFVASRPNADVADIEAKLVLAVFIADEASPIADVASTEAPR